MKKIRYIALLLVMFSLLIAVPTAFAFDGGDAISMDDNPSVLNEDYYFDASLDNDTGDGSIDNPYKDLTSNRIEDDSVIHLKDGEYNIAYSKTINNVTFIGQNSENTIINGNGRVFTVSTSFTLCNVTLMNLKITNNGDLIASGTIFRDSTSSNGGAIESAGNSKVCLDNCTFLNNTATNGGAIYKKDGVLSITNSQFILNSAADYGGAIYCESVYDFSVNDTSFSDNSAIKYFGGAIYLYESDFNALNMIITNSSANFGGAIMARDSYLNLTNLTARQNRAKYNGGAIYTIYGGLYIYESLLQSNQALNGGAIFTDMLNEFECLDNNFTSNFANYTGGAVYDVCSNIFIENNTCFDNHAGVDDDFCLLDVPDLFIGDGNYTLLKINSTYSGDLPSRYDLRELGQVTPVKNQGSGGNCWAFAVLSALESAILKATGISFDLSEENMKNIMAFYSEYGWAMDTNNGGYSKMGYGYLTSWLGPVNESDDVYNYKSFLSPVLHSFLHVQNMIFLERNNYTDNDAIKMAIMNYGAVGTSIYMASKTYQYYTGTGSNDHAVTIVGWDDNLTFNGAPGPGGWIVKNSWGPNSLDHGYFYISYYDVSCARPGVMGDTFAFVLNDTMRYDKNYQYDIPGETDFFFNYSSTVWYKNKFVSTDDEYLAAVSTYFNKQTNWDLAVYVNDELKLTQSGFSLPGYCTIPLDHLIELCLDDEFEIEFKITVDGDAGVAISEDVSLNCEFYWPGISFISYDGENWVDFYGLEGTYPDHAYYSQVACIKAFTILNPIETHINLTVLDDMTPFLIQASVFDEYGNVFNSGKLTFTVDGESYDSDIVDGVAVFSYANSTSGDYLVQASFKAPVGYADSSEDLTVTISGKGIVVVQTNITVSYNNVLIDVNLSKPIDDLVCIDVNDDIYEIYTHEGKGTLNLTFLANGYYTINAYTPSTKYFCINSIDSFEFTYYEETFIGYSAYEAYYGEDLRFYITLSDYRLNPIPDMNITFKVGDSTIVTKTDENGKASLPFANVTGVFDIYAAFDGHDQYMGTSVNVTFTIKSTITLPDHDKYSYNSKYVAYLVDGDGNPLSDRNVTVGSNGEIVSTDSEGKLSVNIDFAPAYYTMSITNPETGERLTQDIQVVKKITGNSNVVMYYGAGKSYTVRVCDDYGDYVSGIKVTIKLNGKTYTKYTDANGYVSLKISLKPGTYTITAEANGYQVSNKVTVKTTIITKDITVKKGKTIKFTAKILNSKGKIVKNKKVSFKFKGKTYTSKTNSKGIATLSLKNSYKVGTYYIYTTYGGLTVKNSIKIKK